MRFEWNWLLPIVLICNLGAGVALAADASVCRFGPTDYLVYSLGNIQTDHSDYQGVTGAAGSVSISSFLIDPSYSDRSSAHDECPSVVAGSHFLLSSGQVRGGGAEIGGNAKLKFAFIPGRVLHGGELTLDQASVGTDEQRVGRNVDDLPEISKSFLAASRRISDTPLEHMEPTLRGGVLTFAGEADIQEFELQADELRQATVMEFRGPSDAVFVVNVRGSEAVIDRYDIVLDGGMKAGQILFNFPDATRLDIRSSGSREWGIPATILAPRASVDFRSARITGGLYVGDLEGNGQVNFASFPWEKIPLPGNGCGCHPHHDHCPAPEADCGQ